jgi:type 1 fimbria pilin
MKKLVSFATLLTLLLSFGLAAMATGKKVTLTGYITDKKCSARGAEHKRACTVKCKDSGIGLFADGKFYQFDAAGTEKALKLMEASTSENVIKADVEGELGDDMTLTVKSIKEAS